MHHLLQLDCGALPFVDPDLPRSGTLMFFVTGSYEESSAPDLFDGGDGAFSVLYQKASPVDTPEHPHPETCPALGKKSYAIQPVRYPLKREKMGFFQRLVNTQPKPYSGSGGTGYFGAVPLEAVEFDSAPTSNAQDVFDTFDAHDNQLAQNKGLRPFQVMGYAPVANDLRQAHCEGYRACSTEKAMAAYDKAAARDDVLLAQLVYAGDLNFDWISEKYALQFWISRADLQARAFERVRICVQENGMDGLWWPPKETPAPYVPHVDELIAQIALNPLTPFEKPRAAGNYFGGAPQMPADMDWPCMGDGYPLGFLMQVDCASVPRPVARGEHRFALPVFPETGTVFLFAYDFMDDLTPESFQILYTPEDTSDLPLRIPPDALMTAPEYGDYSIKHRAAEGKVPRLEPKRPFEPIAFTNIAPPVSGDPEYDEKLDCLLTYGGAFAHEQKAFPGVALVIDWLPNYNAVHFGPNRSFQISDAREVVRTIPQSYPWRWGDIRGAMQTFPLGTHQMASIEKCNGIFGADLIEQGESWTQKANARDGLERIAQADRRAYRAWLLQMDACGANLPPESAQDSDAAHRHRIDLECAFADVMKPLAQPFGSLCYNTLPATLHYLAFDDSADDLPDEMREIVAELVRYKRSDTQLNGNPQYHKPDPDLMFALHPEGQRNDNEVMVFSLASGSGLPVNWGDCCWLQVWIETEDLAAGRFDRIRPTIRW